MSQGADVIVVGAGAAGCSAAWECLQAGLGVLLVSDSLDTVFLADAENITDAGSGSAFARLVAEEAGESARRLHRQAKWLLEREPRLHLLQASVSGLLLEGSRVVGVRTWEGPELAAPLTALCVGSFLGAELESGELREQAGRPGRMSYPDLADDLAAHGVKLMAQRHAFSGSSGSGTVTAFVIDAAELEDGVWLKRLPGTAAAGWCTDPALDFSAATRAGEKLGRALAAQAEAVS